MFQIFKNYKPGKHVHRDNNKIRQMTALLQNFLQVRDSVIESKMQ